jgi:WD40 repeat protein
MDNTHQQKVFLKIDPGTHVGPTNQLLATSDGRHFISSGGAKTIRVWNSVTKTEVRKILGQIGPDREQGMIVDMDLTPDDKYLVVCVIVNGNEIKSSLRLYDLASGKLLKLFHEPDWDEHAESVTFSEDGRFLLHRTSAYTVKICDFAELLNATAPALPRPRFTPPTFVEGTQNAPGDLKMIKVGDDYCLLWREWRDGPHNVDGPGCIRWFNLTTKEEKKYPEEEWPYSEPHDFNPTQLVVGRGHIVAGWRHVADENTDPCHISIFDRNLNLIKEIEELPSIAQALALSPDGKHLVASSGGNLHCFSLETFEKTTTFEKHRSGNVRAITFLDKQTVLTMGGASQEAYFWDPLSGEEKGHIPGNGSSLFAVGLKGNLIGFGRTQDFHLNRVNNYAPLEQILSLDEWTVSDFPNQVDRSDFSRAQGEENFRVHIGRQNSNIWFNGTPLTWGTLQDPEGNIRWWWFESATVTDRFIIAGSRAGEVHVIDRSEPSKLLATLHGHSGYVWDMAVEGNRLVTVGVDQTIRIWNLEDVGSDENIHPLLNIFVAVNRDWIAWSKSGFYDASMDGDKYIGYHINQGEEKEALYYPSDRFLKVLYRPDIIRLVLETGSEEEALQRAGLEEIEIVKRIETILPPRINLISKDQVETDQDRVTLEFEVIPDEDADDDLITRVWILRNDQFLWESTDPSIAKGERFSVEVELHPGKNLLKILAESKAAKSNPVLIIATSNVWTSRGRVQIRDDDDKAADQQKVEENPNLYLLAVGVSKYQNAGEDLSNLNFAHKDARAIVESFRSQEGRTFNKIISKLLVDGEATKQQIELAVKWLRSEVDKRKAYLAKNNLISRDVTIIFLSGHGVKGGDDFYFLNHDVSLENLEETGIRIMDFGQIVTSFPTEILLMTDACHSGMAKKDIIRNINSDELSKRLSAVNERALVIANATVADQEAVEPPNLDHGAFTQAILDGLRQREEMFIMYMPLIVEDLVTKFTEKSPKGVQKPTFRIIGSLENYKIYSK